MSKQASNIPFKQASNLPAEDLVNLKSPNLERGNSTDQMVVKNSKVNKSVPAKLRCDKIQKDWKRPHFYHVMCMDLIFEMKQEQKDAEIAAKRQELARQGSTAMSRSPSAFVEP